VGIGSGGVAAAMGPRGWKTIEKRWFDLHLTFPLPAAATNARSDSLFVSSSYNMVSVSEIGGGFGCGGARESLAAGWHGQNALLKRIKGDTMYCLRICVVQLLLGSWIGLGTWAAAEANLNHVSHDHSAGQGDSRLEPESGAKPLKIFILVGQSNMQGHADLRTLPYLGMHEDTRLLHQKIVDEQGEPRVLDGVWISYRSSDGVRQGPLSVGYGANPQKIGPELTFGITMHEKLQEPVLLIKAAWGGRSLHTDFRPPSAGPFTFLPKSRENLIKQGKDPDALEQERIPATGVAYRDMIAHVRQVLADPKAVCPDYDPEAGFELAGFVWFQGWNDMVDGGVYPERGQPEGYAMYSQLLTTFIRDVRRDLNAPELPFVIGVLGVDGPTASYRDDQKRYVAIHQGFRDAMAAPAAETEFQGNVVAVRTEDCWDLELSAAKAKQQAVKREVKREAESNGWSPQELRSTEEKRLQQDLTARELEMLQLGISNAEFHYLGCSRILGKIGQAFAEANHSLLEKGK
jgi:hypothetical protein